ncbi:ATP-dependent RecD-like DNA helicase [uncultured Photobacterium sp.]|uniref:ATP-dependent DNA helicase n=1 Tax=uncultured Photobacterium sp. TaxID=173973 RepID=UPI0026093D4E|nr:AAA family ATPase [uncultured Photobacterium sp.]
MNDSNFLFLKSDFPKLAELGAAAEHYAYSDTQAAVVKLRCLTELMVGYLFDYLSLSIEAKTDLYSRLSLLKKKGLVDENILSKLHALRIKGNLGAHNSGELSVDEILWLIEESYIISRWFVQTMRAEYIDVPSFVMPAKPSDTGLLLEQNTGLANSLSKQSIALESAQKELELLREELEVLQLSKANVVSDGYVLEQFTELSREVASSFDLKMAQTRSRINIMDSFSDYELTQSQQSLVKQVGEFLQQKEQSVFLLKGYAGTGKTFITKGITHYLDAIGRKFVLLAPTGKAAKVISDKTGQTASTIHRAIYNYDNLKEYTDNGLEGSETYRCYAELKVNVDTSETVYIIDESSMVSDVYSDGEFFRFGSGYLLRDLLDYINLDHNDHTKKVLFIGDNAQLPPVNMNISPALDESYLQQKYNLSAQSYELTDVVRQKGDSGVMKNAQMLRNALDKEIFNQLDFDTSPQDIHALYFDDVLTNYLNACDNNIKKTGNSVIIASSNRQVSEYNKLVRNYFFPNQTELSAGDKIISTANHYTRDFVVTNGEFGMIRQVLSETEVRKVFISKRSEDNKVERVLVELCFRDVEVGFRDDDGQPRFFQCKIVENLLYNDEPILSSDEHKALYVDFLQRNPEYKRKGNKSKLQAALMQDPYFTAFKVKFGYAITCHKAQGSEWPHVIVKCRTHMKTLTKDYFRWLYTAITRTSSTLCVVDEPHLRLTSGIKEVGIIPSLGNQPKAAIDVDGPSQSDTPHMTGNNNNAKDQGVASIATDDLVPADPNLKVLFDTLVHRLSGTDVFIVDIVHHQYQETYVFQRRNEFANITFYYNGKLQVRNLNVQTESELAQELEGRFIDIKGMILIDENQASPPSFAQPFLEEFYKLVVSAIASHGIIVTNVEAGSYKERYFMEANGQRAVFDFYYNGKQQFNKFSPLPTLSNSPEFVRQVSDLIPEVLG